MPTVGFSIRQGSRTPVLKVAAKDGTNAAIAWVAGTSCTWSMAPYSGYGAVGPAVFTDEVGVASDDGSGNLNLAVDATRWPAGAAALPLGLYAVTFKVDIGGSGDPQEWPVGPPSSAPEDYFFVRVEATLG